MDLEGPLYADVFNMNRYILNQVAISGRLYRSKGEFCLNTNESTPDFQVIIEDIVLRVCKVQVTPDLNYGHAEILQKNPSFISLYQNRNQDDGHSIMTQVTLTWDNMFQGVRPNKQIVAFVDSAAVAETYSTITFNFKNYGLNLIGLYVDNVLVGGNSLKLNCPVDRPFSQSLRVCLI